MARSPCNSFLVEKMIWMEQPDLEIDGTPIPECFGLDHLVSGLDCVCLTYQEIRYGNGHIIVSDGFFFSFFSSVG